MILGWDLTQTTQKVPYPHLVASYIVGGEPQKEGFFNQPFCSIASPQTPLKP